VSPGCGFGRGSNDFVSIAADAALALGLDAWAIKTERYGACETIRLALREESFRKRQRSRRLRLGSRSERPSLTSSW
jgi:hypothetical protein